MGVTSSDPCLPLPNVLLMARHRMLAKDLLWDDEDEFSKCPTIDLTRLLPLRYIRLSVHNPAQRILRLQTVTRKVYYLQLHQEHPNAVFALWGRLATILQKGLSITTKDPNIHIRHSLVSSGSSPSSSSSAELYDMGSQSPSVMGSVGRKMTGVFSQLSGKPSSRKESQRKVSFQGLPSENQEDAQVQGDVSPVSNDLEVLYYDLPPRGVCAAQCKARLLPGTPSSGSEEYGSIRSDLDLLPCLDGTSHGLWQQETPSWQQPLCRLSSLVAAAESWK
ncbi:Golgi-associated RAB2 interactor protein 1A isoform X2 [Hemicordylus capensis]|nr:Golgi-associated RAB2 interactor protein 1A isoform X2 [Hemicordylus capensis]